MNAKSHFRIGARVSKCHQFSPKMPHQDHLSGIRPYDNLPLTIPLPLPSLPPPVPVLTQLPISAHPVTHLPTRFHLSCLCRRPRRDPVRHRANKKHKTESSLEVPCLSHCTHNCRGSEGLHPPLSPHRSAIGPLVWSSWGRFTRRCLHVARLSLVCQKDHVGDFLRWLERRATRFPFQWLEVGCLYSLFTSQEVPNKCSSRTTN